jgi:hypothetical protein
MKRSLLTLLLFQASLAQADIITRCFDLHNNATTNASVNSTPMEIPTNDNSKYDAQAFTGEIIASNVSGTTPTLNATIQTCETSDPATCFDTPIIFDTCSTGTCYSGLGSQRIDLNKTNVHLRPFFRAKITLTGTSPVYNARVRLCYK